MPGGADDFRSELRIETGPEDREQLPALARLLRAEIPAPSARFRAELGRRLGVGEGSGSAGLASRGPARIFALAYLIGGLVLLAIAALGPAGLGPFATG